MKKRNKTFKRYTVTSALPYANGPIHLGHLAGAYLPADIYVRYLRSNNREVVYVCGTDEHGASINIRAIEEQTTPRAVVDKYHEVIKNSFESFNISFDHFSRTSNELHHDTAQAFFKKFHDEGKLIEKVSQQLYDEKVNLFLADKFVKGTCPKCGHQDASGDSCEKCGSTFAATELIDPVSTISGTKPVLKPTKHWFLPLDQYEDMLKTYILDDHPEWKPNVSGQCKSWLNEGLKPRAITRDLDWGVKVPVEDADGKVLYVWFDAPIGYITATKEWAKKENAKGNPVRWEDFWQDEETALVHFIGKDNIVFHCIIFPSILAGHGGYILPENVPGNEFLNLEGKKFSTSKNWAIWAHEFAEEFPDKTDIMRFVLTMIMPETGDSDFTWKEYQNINNNTLVADFGNFINRVLVLTHKYFDGVVPEKGELTDQDRETLEAIPAIAKRCGNSIEGFRFKEAAAEMINLARLGNKYLAETEPWKLIKTDRQRVGTILNICLQLSASLSIVSKPFLPEKASKLSDWLGLAETNWLHVGDSDLIKTGSTVQKPELLFEKVEDDTVTAQIEKLEKKANATSYKAKPAKPDTSFDDFQKMDIRVCTILKAEKVKKADKLLKLIVDVGFEQRTVVSGVAKYYLPEELVGKQALILLNLPPRKLRGIESQGMLLFAEGEEGKLALINPDGEALPNGAQVS